MEKKNKTINQDRANQIEAVYNEIRNFVQRQITIFAYQDAGTARNLKEFKEFAASSKRVRITYPIYFDLVKKGILEITQPTLFEVLDKDFPEVIDELGEAIFLDEAMRRAFPSPQDIPEALHSLARIALTPEVLATLNSDPEAIYKRLFITTPADIDTGLRIEELYLLIPPGITPPQFYRQGRGDLTYPLAILGKPKPGQNYFIYENKKAGIRTEAGSMYGVLGEFDFRVLCAIIAFTQRVKDKDGKIISVARFSQYSIARYLNMTPGRYTWKRITEALKKIATFTISHNNFETKGNRSVIDYKRIWKTARTKKEGEDNVDNIFEWDEEWRLNFLNYFEVIDGNIFGQLSGTAGRLHLYLKRRLGSREGVYSEHWESIADRLPLTGKTRGGRKQTFIKSCKEHQEITGIAFRIDAKKIAHFTNHPGKTKEAHQIEARTEVKKRIKRIDQAKEQRALTEEQNRTVATLMKLGVNYKIAGEIAKEYPYDIQDLIDTIEIDANIKYYAGKHDPDAEPEGPNQVAGRWLAEYRTAMYGFGNKADKPEEAPPKKENVRKTLGSKRPKLEIWT